MVIAVSNHIFVSVCVFTWSLILCFQRVDFYIILLGLIFVSQRSLAHSCLRLNFCIASRFKDSVLINFCSNARLIVSSGVSLSALLLLHIAHAMARFQQSSLVPSRLFGSTWSRCNSLRSGIFSVPQYQHWGPHSWMNAFQISWLVS